MSSKTLASALISYGADLRVTNLVLEIIFSILPILWGSKYKLLDFKDELVVDLLFQYVRTILVERKYYNEIMVPLLEEQFRDLDLEALTQTEVSLLCGVALKRLVSQAVHAAGKVWEPHYDNAGHILSQPTSALSGQPQKNFLFEMMKKYLVVEGGNALSFTEATVKSKTEVGPLYRTTTNKWNSQTKKIGAAIVIEPYVSLTLKSKENIILCLEELEGEYDLTVLNTYLNAIAFLVESLTGTGAQYHGNYNFAKISPIEDVISKNTNLDYIDGKTLFSSPQDLETQYKLHPFAVSISFLLGTLDPKGKSYNLTQVIDSVFERGTLSMRATVQQPSSATSMTSQIQAKMFKLKSQTTPEGFARDFYKLLYYEDAKGAGFKTIQVATFDKEYSAAALIGRSMNTEETKNVIDAQYYIEQTGKTLIDLNKKLASLLDFVKTLETTIALKKDMVKAMQKKIDTQGKTGSELTNANVQINYLNTQINSASLLLAEALLKKKSAYNIVEQHEKKVKELIISKESYLNKLELGSAMVPFIKETMNSWWSLENLLWAANNKSESGWTLGESLFINLLSTPEFDALTKSLLAPLTVFNAIQLIPSIEIGSAMREMMRSQGIFQGLDEILDSYMLNLQGYLIGFPFEGCGDLSGII